MSEERIGKYEVLGKIAEGGFGTVYKARDPFIKRVVAIKTCPIHDEEVRHRFFREARIVGGFDHPHVTIVHDFGLEGDRAFLVQEYLSGEDLAEKIRNRTPLSLKRKVGYLLQAARGIAYAHSKGVIHRDIKPANLRVLETDQLKVLDFGIAKLTTSGTHLTQRGVAVGTIGYLSPEQLRELPLDARTDIFSFGVTAYELLTYRKPFRGQDISSVMRAILERDPQPMPELSPYLPAALVEVVGKCLVKDREERYSSFDAVISDLKRIHARLPDEERGAATAPLAVTEAEDEQDPSEAETGEHSTAPVAVGDGAAIAGPLSTRETSPPGAPSPPEPESPPAPSPAPAPALSEPEPPTGNPPAQRWRSVLGLGLLAALLVGGGLGIAWYFYSRQPTAPDPTPQPATPPVEQPAAPAESVPSGVLLVEADPWAEVMSVLNEAGEEMLAEAGRSTPLRIELPPGVYSVVLGSPSLAEPTVCQTEVVAEQSARCMAAVDPVDVSDYFREMGWWR